MKKAKKKTEVFRICCIYVGVIVIALLCVLVARGDTDYVTGVHDGDTFYVSSGLTIRLAEVDCPELRQLYGDVAKKFTEKYLLHQEIRLQITGTDKYGRTVAEVYVHGIWFNRLLAQNGMAWAYKKYASPEVYRDQLNARYLHIGLWFDDDAEPPFLFRQQNK